MRKATPPGQHIRLVRRFVRFQDATRKARKMLKLRSIGTCDYSVFEGEQRIGRIRFADERIPGVWLWNVIVHLTGGLPMGSSKDITRLRPSSRLKGSNNLASVPICAGSNSGRT